MSKDYRAAAAAAQVRAKALEALNDAARKFLAHVVGLGTRDADGRDGLIYLDDIPEVLMMKAALRAIDETDVSASEDVPTSTATVPPALYHLVEDDDGVLCYWIVKFRPNATSQQMKDMQQFMAYYTRETDRIMSITEMRAWWASHTAPCAYEFDFIRWQGERAGGTSGPVERADAGVGTCRDGTME